MRALGNDYSHWQDDNSTPQFNDFTKAVEQGSKFCFIKATQGVGFVDSDFAENWQKSKEAGLFRGAYHLWNNGQSAITQAQHFFDTVNATGDLGEMEPVFDAERIGMPSTALQTFCETTELLWGKKPIIYTAEWSWNTVLGNVAWALEYPLWVAQYLYDNNLVDGYFNEREFDLIENKNPNLVPEPWTEWKFWQFTSKLEGEVWGVESYHLDGDFFNGTEEEFLAEYGEPLPDLEERVAELESTVEAMNIDILDLKLHTLDLDLRVSKLEGNIILPPPPPYTEIIANHHSDKPHILTYHIIGENGAGKPIFAMDSVEERVKILNGTYLGADGPIDGDGSVDYWKIIAPPEEYALSEGKYVSDRDIIETILI